jgi:V/A-type H+-transporting ATPase subunit I
MIVRMSKVEIAGPRRLLEDVLSLLQESGTFQIDPDSVSFIGESREYIKPSLPTSDNLAERLYLENLRDKVTELFSYLPKIDVRNSYIEPPSIIDTITETLKKHTAFCKELSRKRDTMRNEMNELNRYTPFLDTIEPLLRGMEKTPDLDVIGLTIKYPEVVEHLQRLLSRLMDKKIEILTTTAPDGTIVGLIVTESKISNMIKNILSDERIPELSFPPSLKGLSLPAKVTFLNQRISELSSQIAAIEQQLRTFSTRWSPIYKRVKEWVEERLSILGVTTSAFQTRMCFFIYGWMPTREVGILREMVNRKFGGKVTIEEKEIQEEDLERVPVVLKNPAYFQPFELFTRLLPLPRYTSYDPTPFIGIFFPIFFGMILGDAGYGLVLLITSLIFIKKFRGIIQDASKILSVCSAYSILFGALYGECFGELPKLLGIEYVCIERRTAIIPMLFFAVTVGIVHILLGLFLGFLSSLKEKNKERNDL